MTNIYLVKSLGRWSVEALDGKSVNFRIIGEDGVGASGSGRFSVTACGDKFQVTILGLTSETVFHHALSQEAVDRIEAHPEGPELFRCWRWY